MGNLRNANDEPRAASGARFEIAPPEAWSYAAPSRHESSFKHPAAALLVAALILVGGLSITSAVTAKAHTSTSSSGAVQSTSLVATAPVSGSVALMQGSAVGGSADSDGSEKRND